MTDNHDKLDSPFKAQTIASDIRTDNQTVTTIKLLEPDHLWLVLLTRRKIRGDLVVQRAMSCKSEVDALQVHREWLTK